MNGAPHPSILSRDTKARQGHGVGLSSDNLIVPREKGDRAVKRFGLILLLAFTPFLSRGQEERVIVARAAQVIDGAGASLCVPEPF